MSSSVALGARDRFGVFHRRGGSAAGESARSARLARVVEIPGRRGRLGSASASIPATARPRLPSFPPNGCPLRREFERNRGRRAFRRRPLGLWPFASQNHAQRCLRIVAFTSTESWSPGFNKESRTCSPSLSRNCVFASVRNLRILWLEVSRYRSFSPSSRNVPSTARSATLVLLLLRACLCSSCRAALAWEG